MVQRAPSMVRRRAVIRFAEHPAPERLALTAAARRAAIGIVTQSLVLLPACRGSTPDFDPPTPALADDISQLPRLPPSTLNVPVEFDLTP
jgi:hypothetical protein